MCVEDRERESILEGVCVFERESLCACVCPCLWRTEWRGCRCWADLSFRIFVYIHFVCECLVDACIDLITWFTAVSVLCKGGIERAGRILCVCESLREIFWVLPCNCEWCLYFWPAATWDSATL